MHNKLNFKEVTPIGMGVNHHEICFDPVMGAVAILEENEITDTYNVLDMGELEALTNGAYFQSLQYL